MAEETGAGTVGPELVQRIARGEREALAELYDRSSRMVYGIVLGIVRDSTIAEQMTLDVYMQVWRTASHYKPGRGSVNGWLAAIVRTQALEWRRSRQAPASGFGQGPYLEAE